jgi:hypothetical protein
MNRLLIVTVMFILPTFSFAQHGNLKGKWHISAAATLLNGNTRTGSAVTGNIRYQWKDRWTLGLGSGIDHYYFRSVPVFVDIQRYAGKQHKGLFFYGSSGLNIPWPTEDQRMYRQGWGWGSMAQPSQFSGGFWTDLGLGYGFKGKKGHGMFVRAGHSLKTMEQSYTEQVWNGTSSVTALREISYLFGRISIQAGFTF